MERVAHVVMAAGFLSRYLNVHIKNVSSASLNKTFPTILPDMNSSQIIFSPFGTVHLITTTMNVRGVGLDFGLFGFGNVFFFFKVLYCL